MNENDTIVVGMEEPLLHRRLHHSQVVFIVFFLVFGALVLSQICLIALRSWRARQREPERQRQAIQKKIRTVLVRRQDLMDVIKDNALAKVLTASNFKRVPSMNKSDDIEVGNNQATNIITYDESNYESTTEIPQGQDEMAIRSSDNAGHPLHRIIKSQEPCQRVALQSIDKERMDSLSAELGEVQFMRNQTLMSIPIQCSICLENYKEGDTVLVSNNVSCTHGFHQECVLDYLARREGKSSPCPCCRQVFLSTETISEVLSDSDESGLRIAGTA